MRGRSLRGRHIRGQTGGNWEPPTALRRAVWRAASQPKMTGPSCAPSAAHGVQLVHVVPRDRGLEAERDAVFDQRFDPGATTGVTAGDAGDRLVGRGGGTVERDFGATGRGLRQAHGYPVGDERAVSEQVDDEAHAEVVMGKMTNAPELLSRLRDNLGGDPDGADGSAFVQLYAVEGGKGGEIALVLKGEFDGGDLGGIAVGEVGDVAFFDFAVLAEGFAE